MTEYEFWLALRGRFPAKEYALLPQVRNGTGFARDPRTADAIAVSLWPSRGIWAHGFEFKDSRTDWLKELKQPEKADEIGKHCAFWSVVVSESGIVKDAELPPMWGLMLASSSGVKVLRPAPRREAQEPGWLFAASVLRAAVEVVTDETAITKRVQEAKSKGREEAQKANESIMARQDEQHKNEIGRLKREIADFEAASGIKIETWRHIYGDNLKIGQAVNLLLRGGLKEEIVAFEAALRRIDGIRNVADELKSLCNALETKQS